PFPSAFRRLLVAVWNSPRVSRLPTYRSCWANGSWSRNLPLLVEDSSVTRTWMPTNWAVSASLWRNRQGGRKTEVWFFGLPRSPEPARRTPRRLSGRGAADVPGVRPELPPSWSLAGSSRRCDKRQQDPLPPTNLLLFWGSLVRRSPWDQQERPVDAG